MGGFNWRRRRGLDERLTALPDYELVGVLRIPESHISPARAIWRRVAVALAALLIAVTTVYLGRDGYMGCPDEPMSILDCLYYATVSLIDDRLRRHHAVHPSARLINVLVITPLRVAFLIVLIGTTVETLTAASRQA